MTTEPTAEQPPLNVLIVGAGIAGLSAAIALRRSGHKVQVFESAEEIADIGAAIVIPPNCQYVLESFGYSKDNLNSVVWEAWSGSNKSLGGRSVKRQTGTLACIVGSPESTSQLAKVVMCHRSDLLGELKRLVLRSGDGPAAVLHLGSKVVGCDSEAGTLELSDGQRFEGDLILGADGIGSTMRTHILGRVQKSIGSGRTIYRALIARATLDAIPELAWLREGAAGPRMVLKQGSPYRLLFMYPCRGDTFLNFIGQIDDDQQEEIEWKKDAPRSEFQALYTEFHPKFQALFAELPQIIPRWQLRTVPALPTWIRGRAALMGDAAHATLPTMGQGAAMAVEEAGALGALFPAGTGRADVPARLVAYEQLRKARGEFVGRESLDQATVPAKYGVYNRSKEMQEMMMEYNAVKAAQDCLQDLIAGSQGVKSN
ncbi:FAD/NAD(P)-binding domain-containing protein [Mycena crocata]|nr:FAD/NAD(P)-binding domain-containing protein [Mycena crocata]